MLLWNDHVTGKPVGRGYLSAAVLVFLAGAVLRFYALGVPSMWTDEMLVPLNASQSARYIFSLSENVEVHPPYFYFLYKLLLQFGSSDYWLRLPSALCGTLTLLAVWRVGRRVLEDDFAALAAMALLAAHPLHIWVSRQVRPYALIGLCAVLAMGYLFGYLRDGKGRKGAANLLASLPIAMVHYLGLLFLATQGIAAGLAWLVRRIPSLGSMLGYGTGLVLCAAPSAYFFWQAKFRRHEAVIEAGRGFSAAVNGVSKTLADLLAFGTDIPYAWAAMGLLMLTGACMLALKRSRGVLLVLLFAGPPVLLVAAQYASHLYAVHLSFLLPPAVLLAGAGLEALSPAGLRRPAAVLVLLCCLGGAFVALKAKDYYDAKGVVATWWHMGFYKDIASTLRHGFTPQDMVAFHDPNLFSAVNWYGTHMPGPSVPGVPADQELTPDKPMIQAVFVTNHQNFGHYFKDEGQFRGMFGESAAVQQRDNIRYYLAAVARLPELRMDGRDFVLELTAAPRDVYSRAWSLKDLTVWPYFGCSLYPTKPRSDCSVTYRIENCMPEQPQRLGLLVEYSMNAPGDLLRLECRFDGGPWKPLLEESGAVESASRLVRIRPEGPFQYLWLRATLRAGAEQASSEVGPLHQVKLHHLLLYHDAPGARFGSGALPLAELGLSGFEVLGGPHVRRWGLGPATHLRYTASEAGKLELTYRFTPRLPGQDVEILHGTERVALYENPEPGREIAGRAVFDAVPGQGEITIRYARWNHKDEASTFAPGDPRPIAALFSDLSLEPAGGAGKEGPDGPDEQPAPQPDGVH